MGSSTDTDLSSCQPVHNEAATLISIGGIRNAGGTVFFMSCVLLPRKKLYNEQILFVYSLQSLVKVKDCLILVYIKGGKHVAKVIAPGNQTQAE